MKKEEVKNIIMKRYEDRKELPLEFKTLIDRQEENGEIFRITLISNLFDALNLLCSISKSIRDCVGMGIFGEGDKTKQIAESDKEGYVNTALDLLAVYEAKELAEKATDYEIGLAQSISYEDKEIIEKKISAMLLEKSKHQKTYREKFNRTTWGDVSFGWEKYDDSLYLVYVGYTRKGSLISNAEYYDMIKLPEYEKTYVCHYQWQDTYENHAEQLIKKANYTKEFSRMNEFED